MHLNRETTENWYVDATHLTDNAPANTVNYVYNLSQLTDAYDNSSGYHYGYDTLEQLQSGRQSRRPDARHARFARRIVDLCL